MKLVIFKSTKRGRTQTWYWRLVAKNNRIRAIAGEPFASARNAERAFTSMRIAKALVTIEPHDLITMITEHLRVRLKGMIGHAPTEHLEVSFPTPVQPVQAAVEVKRNPINERDQGLPMSRPVHRIPGHDVDRIDVKAGLAELTACGYTEPETIMVIEYALMRWARGEEEAAQRGAIDRSFHGISLTCWIRVVAAARAHGEANA